VTIVYIRILWSVKKVPLQLQQFERHWLAVVMPSCKCRSQALFMPVSQTPALSLILTLTVTIHHLWIHTFLPSLAFSLYTPGTRYAELAVVE